jgi:acetyl esterase/lipase
VSYGTDPLQKFDISIPINESSAHAIVYIHGGSLTGGDKGHYPQFIKDYADNAVIASINYRLIAVPPASNNIHVADIIQDTKDAMQKIKDVSNENGVTISDVIFMGHSAGAHISLLYSYEYFPNSKTKPIPISACVSLAGPTDFSDAKEGEGYASDVIHYSLTELKWMAEAYTGAAGLGAKITQKNYADQSNFNSELKAPCDTISAIKFVDQPGGVPPTLLVHSVSDDTVPYSNATRLNDKLQSAGIPHQMHTVEGGHGLGKDDNNPFSFPSATIVIIKTWLNTFL